MTNRDYSEISNSTDCVACQPNTLKEIKLREAKIGKDAVIKRALPSREKRMIGAWCFLDHAGPVQFLSGQGLNVGPHPHIGLQTFTWMIDGTMLHSDSLGYKQLICPKQVNLMTAGHGIAHAEVAPETETTMHAAQLWIALPDEKRNIPPQFDHYAELPKVSKNGALIHVLVGDFVEVTSPVHVHTAMMGADIEAVEDTDIILQLNPAFEYGVIALEQQALVNGHALTQDNMLVIETQNQKLHIQMQKGSRLLLIGGEPFEQEIILWWNFVARTTEEIKQAREQWMQQDLRFGDVPDYEGDRLIAPEMPDRLKASK